MSSSPKQGWGGGGVQDALSRLPNSRSEPQTIQVLPPHTAVTPPPSQPLYHIHGGARWCLNCSDRTLKSDLLAKYLQIHNSVPH